MPASKRSGVGGMLASPVHASEAPKNGIGRKHSTRRDLDRGPTTRETSRNNAGRRLRSALLNAGGRCFESLCNSAPALSQDPYPQREPDTERACALVEAVIVGSDGTLQPPYWLAEVSAVLARVSTETAVEDAEMLAALRWPVSDDSAVMSRATHLAIATGQYVFDTLYHAVAIEQEDALLITADERYLAKAQNHGRILALAAWEPIG